MLNVDLYVNQVWNVLTSYIAHFHLFSYSLLLRDKTADLVLVEFTNYDSLVKCSFCSINQTKFTSTTIITLAFVRNTNYNVLLIKTPIFLHKQLEL